MLVVFKVNMTNVAHCKPISMQDQVEERHEL